MDFSAQLAKLRAQKPDAIVLGTLAEEAAAILRQGRQLGIDSKTTFIGCNANISAKLFELAGPAASGIIVGAAWFAGYDSPRSKAFVEAYRKRYGTTPDIYAARGYDAAYLLAEAIRRADDVTSGRAPYAISWPPLPISKAFLDASAGRRSVTQQSSRKC